MIITSPANERLKQARRVRDGRERGLIFVEGERLVEECLQSGLKLFACFHSPELSERAEKIIEELARRRCPIYPVADAVLETVSDTVSMQGLIVLAERPAHSFDRVLPERYENEKFIVCLDAVQDPGNFGAIVRTSEAAGASGLIALNGTVDAFAPKTLRSSMGSAFRLPIVTDIEGERLEDVRAAGLRIVATDAHGDVVYSDYDWRQPIMVVFGNEARGVGAELLERCDARLRIPLRPPVESLNVAAAAAAVLFEAARQRRSGRL
jgi:TrmH family RNA methyltransferase